MSLSDALDRAADALRDAGRILFVTGAGLSADSGLPTYRGVGGLYDGGATEEGLPIEEALSGPVFARDPALTWRYIRQIEAACRGATPNDAHRLIAALDREGRAVTLTQNVDGLHRAAGAREVIEIHGTLHALACTACAYRRAVADYEGLPPLPRCPDCGAVVRPEVVLFEEALPEPAIARLQRELRRGFDVVVSAGTSAVFPYIAGPVRQAAREGRPTIEIDPGETELSDVVSIRVQAGAALAARELAARLGIALAGLAPEP